jgi:hypothetical protein
VPRQAFGLNAAAAATVQISPLLAVPADRNFVPMAWGVTIIPGAAQSLLWWYLQAQVTGSSNQFFRFDSVNSPALNVVQQYGRRQDGMLFIPPGWDVIFVAGFDAGVAVNTVTATLYGYSIPRGNLALP